MNTLGSSERTLSAAGLVGRVGSLAVVLGVGAGMFTGLAVACADSSSDSPSSAGPANSESAQGGSSSSAGSSTRARRGSAAAPRRSTGAGSDPVDTGSATPATTLRASTVVRSAAAVPQASEAVTDTPVVAAPQPAPSSNNDSPPAAATPMVTTAAPTASAQSAVNGSVTGSASEITVDPTIAWGGKLGNTNYPGVLVGTLNAQSTVLGVDLVYKTISAPDEGGKLGAKANTSPGNTRYEEGGAFSYIPDAATLANPTAVESFKVMVAQDTQFDKWLQQLPLIGSLMPNLIWALHRTPILGNLLSPVIGQSLVVTFDAKPYELSLDPLDPTKQLPTAFTTMVKSFDGLMVSTNYFPSTKVALGQVDSAPTVLNGPGLGAPGNTDVSNPYAQLSLFPWTDPPTPRTDQFGSLTPGLPVLRDDVWVSPDGGPSYDGGGGYNVITWDPRGEWATKDRSLPGLQIDNPFFEGRDASAIISWAYSPDNLAQSQVKMETPGDPLIGMVGGSYGGGIQWVTAGTDPRIDAISPQISWNSLISSLYPNGNQFKTGWGTVLLAALAVSGADINSQIYNGIFTGVTLGWLSQTAQAVLSSAGPTVLLNNIDIPTLIFQGMEDGLFPLAESIANAETLTGNIYGPETKMTWFCGGHGTCLYPLNTAQDDRGLVDNLKWLDQYVAGNGTPAETIPTFQWYDQFGDYYYSDKLPFQAGFNRPAPYTATDAGGTLGVWPLLGGSGPGFVENVPFLLTFPNGTPARNALEVDVTPAAGPGLVQVVGSPDLTFTYTGLGTTRTVYAQLVADNGTDKPQVVQNIVTPIPVTLDGREHTTTISMADIGYTAKAGQTLTLQITSSATNFENFTSYGLVNISDIKVDLPIRAV